ncbi:MAG TPA: 50S ribosomal protein L25 [Vicinamibacteria bacterium]|nr:50S ribosomal protein L25 [Vicinamibacteria bacterium]
MASLTMEAEPRSAFGKGPSRRLRAEGKVPAVLYGGGKESVPLTLDPRAVTGIIRSHGGINTIFELAIKGNKGKENVMITDYQIEPVQHHLLHADLIRVAMDKELTLDVAIELTGVAIGVKQAGGILDFITRTVEISCLPKDIPETIVADVSALDMGDYLRAADLSLPDGVKLVSEPNVVIAHVIAPKVEVEEKPAEEAAAEAPAEGEGAEARPGAPAEGESDKD